MQDCTCCDPYNLDLFRIYKSTGTNTAGGCTGNCLSVDGAIECDACEDAEAPFSFQVTIPNITAITSVCADGAGTKTLNYVSDCKWESPALTCGKKWILEIADVTQAGGVTLKLGDDYTFESDDQFQCMCRSKLYNGLIQVCLRAITSQTTRTCTPCNVVANRYKITINGVSNNTCNNCAQLDGEYIVNGPGVCQWSTSIDLICTNCTVPPFPPVGAKGNVHFSRSTSLNNWICSFAIGTYRSLNFGSFQCQTCGEAVYALPAGATFNCLGETTLTLATVAVPAVCWSGVGPTPPFCNWPGTIKVTAVA